MLMYGPALRWRVSHGPFGNLGPATYPYFSLPGLHVADYTICFQRMKDSLEKLAGQIKSQSDEPIDIHDFPN